MQALVAEDLIKASTRGYSIHDHYNLLHDRKITSILRYCFTQNILNKQIKSDKYINNNFIQICWLIVFQLAYLVLYKCTSNLIVLWSSLSFMSGKDK